MTTARGRGSWRFFFLVAPALVACSGEEEPPVGAGDGVSNGGASGSAGSSSLGVGGRAGSGAGGRAGAGGQAGAEASAGAAGESSAGGASGAAGAGGAIVPECLADAACPAPPDCRRAVCSNGTCVTEPTDDGKALPDPAPGDCQTLICQGGAPVPAPAATDVPPAQGSCFVPVCESGAPTQTVRAERSACVLGAPPGDAGLCDAVGVCVACLADGDCSDEAFCDAARTCQPRAHVITTTPATGTDTGKPRGPFVLGFDRPMKAASLSAQPTDGPCTGSIQLSLDAFASCVGVDLETTPITADAVTLTPKRPIYLRTPYEARITAQAEDTEGRTAKVETPLVFRSMGDPAFCDSGVVIAAVIVGAGTNAAAALKGDYVLLKNRSSFPVAIGDLTLVIAAGDPASTAPAGRIYLPNVAIPASGYYLVETAARGGTGAGLPLGIVPDYSLKVQNMSAVNIPRGPARVWLQQFSSGALEACPKTFKVDFFGYGTATNCGEGSSAFLASAITGDGGAFVRKNDGCSDTDDNTDDFTSVGAAGLSALFHDTSDTGKACTCGAIDDATAALVTSCKITSAPSITETQFEDVAGGVTASISVVGKTSSGQTPSIIVQGGFGPDGTNPESEPGWTWRPAVVFGPVQSDVAPYHSPITCPTKPATYRYGFRFSVDGATWQYCDHDGVSATDPFRVSSLATLICKPQEL